jgi:hypothetical protein
MSADSLLRVLERLPRSEPNPARAARVRARCHAVLASQQPRRQRPKRGVGSGIWEPALVGLCLVYLSDVVRQALQLFGVL